MESKGKGEQQPHQDTVNSMIELLDKFAKIYEMVRNGDQITVTSPHHDKQRIEALLLTPQQARMMEVTFGLASRTFRQRRQITNREGKRRGETLENGVTKRDRKTSPAGSP